MTTKQKLDIALTASGIPKSKKFKETKKHLSIVWDGDQSVNAGVIVQILRDNDINYDDPRGNTNDVYFKVEPAGNTTVRTVMTMDRLDRKGYDAILETAKDDDGDGKFEMDPASDDDEAKAEAQRKAEADKNLTE